MQTSESPSNGPGHSHEGPLGETAKGAPQTEAPTSTPLGGGMSGAKVTLHRRPDGHHVVEKEAKPREFLTLAAVFALQENDSTVTEGFPQIYGVGKQPNRLNIRMEYLEPFSAEQELDSNGVDGLIDSLRRFQPSFEKVKAHSLRPDLRAPAVFARLRRWCYKRAKKTIPHVNELERVFSDFETIPSHNDFFWTNIGRRKKTGQLVLFDFELSRENIIGADFHHFASSAETDIFLKLTDAYASHFGHSVELIRAGAYVYAAYRAIDSGDAPDNVPRLVTAAKRNLDFPPKLTL